MLLEVKDKFQKVTGTKVFAAIVTEVLESQHPFDQQKEQFFVIGLNTKHSVRYIDLVSVGTLDATLVHPRDVFRHAVTQGVAKIALAHNHPSGEVDPSDEDIAVTKRLAAAGKTLGIEVLDHVIVGNGSQEFYSMQEHSSWLLNPRI